MATDRIALAVPRGLATISATLPVLFLPTQKAADLFIDFFTANIRNKNTRRAYYKAVCRFSDWSVSMGLAELGHVKFLTG